MTIGSIGGFIGNFFLGLVPYKMWHRLFKEEPHCRTASSLLKYEFVVLTHSGVVVLIIPYWTELVGFVPFTPLAFIIFFNELVSAVITAPILMALVYPRAKKAGWLWTDVMKGYQYTSSEVKSYHKLGGALVFFSGVIGLWITILVGETSLNLSPMVVNEVSVVGSRCGPFKPAIKALATGIVQVEKLVDSVFSLDEYEEAFALASEKDTLKVLLKTI